MREEQKQGQIAKDNNNCNGFIAFNVIYAKTDEENGKDQVKRRTSNYSDV